MNVRVPNSEHCLRRLLSGSIGGILEPVCPVCNEMEEEEREMSWVRVALSLPRPPDKREH